MAKPILLIRLEKSENSQTSKVVAQRVQKQLIDEYHVFATIGTKDYIEFEAHNAINATDIEIEELKEKVLEQIKSIKNEESI